LPIDEALERMRERKRQQAMRGANVTQEAERPKATDANE
jgi:hypothetical protein